jgi:hypothetical protein
MILIFDTNGGLCNQFYDIINAINFCLSHNIYFTFRYCAFRNDNLLSWYSQPFEKLFDTGFLDNYHLYINYHTIKDNLTNENCFNLNSDILAPIFLNENHILEQLINLNKEYVVLKQFWSLYKFRVHVYNITNINIIPSRNIMNKYIELRNSIVNNKPYNFIHYRYEIDFTDYFKIDIESLDSLLERLKFQNNELNIYIATTNVKHLLNLNDSKYHNILYKDDDSLFYFNFEERAFIDYMFGINSIECYGHIKSSFSHMINQKKSTYNFYNK